MPKRARKASAVAERGVPCRRTRIVPLSGVDEAEDAFQRHGFAGAGAADDDHRLALGDLEIDPAQDLFGAKGLMGRCQR